MERRKGSGLITKARAKNAAASAPTKAESNGHSNGEWKKAVEQAAYFRFLNRGGEHGNDQDDWYAAEQELKNK